MIVVILFSALCLILTYLESVYKLKFGMLFGFVGITILYCIHFDYGTDYMTYYSEYLNVTRYSYSLNDFFKLDNWHNGEYGWALLNWLFSKVSVPAGFFILVAFNSIIENAIIYSFIRNKVDSKNWTFSVFLYLFTPSFYLLGFSMMRQWLAMCLFLLAYDFLSNKRFIWSLLIIYIASTIHQTAIILFPFAFVGYLPMRFSKFYSLFFLFLFVLLMFEGEVLNSALGLFMAQSEVAENYVTNYTVNAQYDATETFRIGFLLNIIPFVLSVYYLLKSNNREKSLMVLIACVGTIVIPFSQVLPMVKRLSLYFSLLSIGTFPIVYSAFNDKKIKYVFICILIFMQFVGYWGFMHDPSYVGHYLEFNTVFSLL